jgi:hypothetical protein
LRKVLIEREYYILELAIRKIKKASVSCLDENHDVLNFARIKHILFTKGKEKISCPKESIGIKKRCI